MSEHQDAPGDLRDELRQLGSNLKALLEAAWESEERKRAQAEVASALSEAAAALTSAARELAGGPAGQKLREEVEEWTERLRQSEARQHARSELVAVLRRMNAELAEMASRWPASGGERDEHRQRRGEA